MAISMESRYLGLSFLLLWLKANAFVPPSIVAPSKHVRHSFVRSSIIVNAKKNTNQNGALLKNPNWIERSFPMDFEDEDEAVLAEQEALEKNAVEDYDMGIGGEAFQSGPLSRKMYDAIMSNNKFADQMTDEIRKSFTLYAMDLTAKEVTRAALKQNGLELVLSENEEEEDFWGDVDSVQLLEEYTNRPIGKPYESMEAALDEWSPGQPFNFVVRQVPAKIRQMSFEELMNSMDPDGKLREQAKEKNIALPTEEIVTLKQLAADCSRRAESAPKGAEEDDFAFAGLDKRGYTPISRSDLLQQNINEDGTENHKTLMHVMDALATHGALVVDLTDEGTNFKLALKMSKMWEAGKLFYDALDGRTELESSLPGMQAVDEETGSLHAKVGYANVDNGEMQCLETRFVRSDNTLLPKEAQDILGIDATDALRGAFDVVCDLGKDIVRVSVGASSAVSDAFLDDLEREPSEEDELRNNVKSSQAALLMANELMDDGKVLGDSSGNADLQQGSVNMSPHRLYRYTNKGTSKPNDKKTPSSSRDIFGAHTDSSFLTCVPVAAVSGLEVLDEDTEYWYRPELMARKSWQKEMEARGEDPLALFETIPGEDGEETQLPWHARYIVVMPGEFMQLTTRDEVPAAVHRVVATENKPSRLSAPILLCGRPGMKLDVTRYLGHLDLAGPLLNEVNGKSMDEVNNAMQ